MQLKLERDHQFPDRVGEVHPSGATWGIWDLYCGRVALRYGTMEAIWRRLTVCVTTGELPNEV